MFGKKNNSVTYDSMVEVSRTKTVNYQAVRIGVSFRCPPEVNYSDGFRLAEFLVEARINGTYYKDEAESFDAIYSAIFNGDSIKNYLKELAAVKKPKTARRSGFFELPDQS